MSRSAGSKLCHYLIFAAILLTVVPLSAQAERGDLNLNGIPFELADAQLFEGYFTNGVSVFTIDPQAQIAATDINGDELVLSVADYVMMLRIIFQGLEANPADSILGDVYTGLTDSTIDVYSYFDDSMKTVSLLIHMPDLVSYDITLLPGFSGMQVTTYQSAALGDLIIKIDGDASTHFPNHFAKILKISYDGSPAGVEYYSAFGFDNQALKIVLPDPGMIGDINMNGIPYEIADAVVFANYFVYGEIAFTISPSRQISTTDLNQDGVPLTLQDFGYLLAVLHDEIEPGDPSGPPVAGGIILQENAGSIVVKTAFAENVRAFELSYFAPGVTDVSANLVPSIPDMDMGNFTHGDTLIFNAYSFSGATFPAGDFTDLMTITYSGPQPVLIGVDAAGSHGQRVDFGTIPCNVLMGDFDGGFDRNLVDILGIVGVVYGHEENPYGGFIDAADANCDCAVDLTDILKLINNIYNAGVAPCTCNEWLTNCSGQ